MRTTALIAFFSITTLAGCEEPTNNDMGSQNDETPGGEMEMGNDDSNDEAGDAGSYYESDGPGGDAPASDSSDNEPKDTLDAYAEQIEASNSAMPAGNQGGFEPAAMRAGIWSVEILAIEENTCGRELEVGDMWEEDIILDGDVALMFNETAAITDLGDGNITAMALTSREHDEYECTIYERATANGYSDDEATMDLVVTRDFWAEGAECAELNKEPCTGMYAAAYDWDRGFPAQ